MDTWSGRKHTPETRAKMAEAARARWERLSQEERDRIRDNMAAAQPGTTWNQTPEGRELASYRAKRREERRRNLANGVEAWRYDRSRRRLNLMARPEVHRVLDEVTRQLGLNPQFKGLALEHLVQEYLRLSGRAS